MFGSLSSVYGELEGRVELGGSLTEDGPRKLRGGTGIITTQCKSEAEIQRIKPKLKARWKEE